MLRAPAAPAPIAIAPIATTAITGFIAPGAIISPTKAVNTASAMTRGFKSAKKSPAVASERRMAVSLRRLSLVDISDDHQWYQVGWATPFFDLDKITAKQGVGRMAEDPGHLENVFR